MVETRDRQTDEQTNTGHHFIMPLPMEVGGIIVISDRASYLNKLATQQYDCT